LLVEEVGDMGEEEAEAEGTVPQQFPLTMGPLTQLQLELEAPEVQVELPGQTEEILFLEKLPLLEEVVEVTADLLGQTVVLVEEGAGAPEIILEDLELLGKEITEELTVVVKFTLLVVAEELVQ
jgi:hypothetical protein